MNRLSRLALTGSTGFTLLITHAYLDFVRFENLFEESEHLYKLSDNLGRLETALALISLALAVWTFLPKKEN
jgi:hypothetical protein